MRASGLELNTDKTEIMRLRYESLDGVAHPNLNFNVRYCGKTYALTTLKEVKVNRI